LDKRENILISVERKYVARMLSGSKTIELRRRALRVSIGTIVWIYSTAPYALVDTVARVETIVSGPPRSLWETYKERTGVTREEFDNYFLKTSIGWGVVLRDIQPLRAAVTLTALRRHTRMFHPPQFFMRLQQGSNTLQLLQDNSQ
jgi:predicted transcriptional regulator